MEFVENSKGETMDIIVSRGTREQIEALATAHAGTYDQIADRLIRLGLEAYRAEEPDNEGTT